MPARHGSDDRDLDRELAQWVDELTARYEAQGVPSPEARRRALIDTEGVEQVKERVRDVRRLRSVRAWLADKAWVDLAMAWRSLKATPAATAAAILTLAVAVGLNVAMTGLIDRLLLSPPAGVSDASRLFTLRFRGTGAFDHAFRIGTSPADVRAIRDDVPAVAGAAAFQRTTATAIVDGDQRQIVSMQVSADYFAVLGARPRLGAGMPRAGGAVVVLGHAFWHAAFGGDAGVIGRHVTIRGEDYLVAGVMPEGFSGHSTSAVDVWTPLATDLSNATVLVRVRADTTREAAESQVSAVIGSSATFTPVTGSDIGEDERRIAWWLLGISVLVLVIGVANTGTLLAVRASRRREELAVRAALGASRARLAAQALLEALLIAAGAAILSIILGSWLDESIRRLLFPRLVSHSALAARTLLAAAGAGAVAALGAGLVNLWQLRAPLLAESVSAARARRTRALTPLLLLQTALSVWLVAGAGVFGRSFYNLTAQDLGMSFDRVVIVEFGAGPGMDGAGALFFDALEQVRALPGVTLATTINSLPFGSHNVPPISVPGRAEPPSVGGQLPYLNAATPEYFRILGVTIVDGRSFTADDARGAPVVIVNETMARDVWPGQRAIGKCIRIGFDPDFDPSEGPPVASDRLPCRQVVGIAKDVRQRSLEPAGNEARLMQYYVPPSQIPHPPMVPPGPRAAGLLLKLDSDADLEALVQPIRRTVIGARKNLPFLRVVAYSDLLEPQLRPFRTGATLLGLFSALALIVSGAGLYAVFAHAVAERRREMAIRLAIGARPAGLQWLILRKALGLAGAGAVLGCAGAAASGRWVASLLFQTTSSDPLVLAGATAAMLVVAACATILPAHAAAKADPNTLLKVE
jgi:putative ABC transport system permease protein